MFGGGKIFHLSLVYFNRLKCILACQIPHFSPQNQPLSIYCFGCENFAQIQPPEIVLGMLQTKKPVTRLGGTVSSFIRTEVSRLQINRLAYNKMLSGALWMPCVKERENKWCQREQKRWKIICLIESHGLDKTDCH